MGALFRLPHSAGGKVAVILLWWPLAAGVWLVAIPWVLLLSPGTVRVRR